MSNNKKIKEKLLYIKMFSGTGEVLYSLDADKEWTIRRKAADLRSQREL